MACEVWFYHLERTGLDQALPELLEKTLARGWRALVRCGSEERLEHLDGWLWAYRDESFLAHGLAEAPEAERQPVLLTTGERNANAAQVVFLVDGASPPSALDSFERCAVLFDGRDPGAAKAARSLWRDAKGCGAPVSYWRQSEEGGWRKQA